MLYILYQPSSWWDYIIKGIKRQDVVTLKHDYKLHFFLRIFRRIFRIFKIYPMPFYFSHRIIKMLKSLEDNDCLLLLNMGGTFPYVLQKITKYLPSQVKKTIWFSNPCNKMFNNSSVINRINEIKRAEYIIYTFDEKDALKFDLLLLNQVYGYSDSYHKLNFEHDFYFCGATKDRYNKITEIKKILDERAFKTNFIVIDKPSSYIKYEMNIHNIMKSRCIVDIVQPGQTGITFRPLESIFFCKKLLTNYENINNYDFYNRNNIFIIGKDDYNDLETFMERPYEPVHFDIINRYDVNNWLNNFL